MKEKMEVYYDNVKYKITSNFGNVRIQTCLLHRDGDLPAVIWKDGSKHWWKNGSRHRDGNLPAIINNDGRILWYVNGLRHRINGPAVYEKNMFTTCIIWYIKGKNYVFFDPSYLRFLQLFIKIIFFNKYNKLIYHPESLAGKVTKCNLFLFFSSLKN